MTAVVVALLFAAAVLALAGFVVAAAVSALVAALLLIMLGISLHTARRGKFLVWAEILDDLRLKGDERALDAGCGRGAVLTMVAERLPRGRVVGIDIWSRRDQSGNSTEAAERNLAAEGVRERCELVTGDMRAMPFPDASFDLIVSSLAIHNILGSVERSRAIDEIPRTLAPCGRVAIADLACTDPMRKGLRRWVLSEEAPSRVAFLVGARVSGDRPGDRDQVGAVEKGPFDAY